MAREPVTTPGVDGGSVKTRHPGRSRPPAVLRDERGATLALVALGMIVFLGITALAVDMGVLYTARTESQRVADAAALAGASAFIESPGNEALARQLATEQAARNDVQNTLVTLLPEDIEVMADSEKVRVTVRHTGARGNAIPTIFARVLGVMDVDVVTVAAAETWPAGSANCPLPLALPDLWIDDGNGVWDGMPTDTYVPWPEPGFTSYTEKDIGLLIEIKNQNQPPGGGQGGGGSTGATTPCVSHPSWDCWWRPAPPSGGGGGGAAALAEWILDCPDPSEAFSIGDDIWAASATGAKQSLVVNEFPELIAQDPGASYDPGCQCIVGSAFANSPRLRAMPVIDPSAVSDVGANLTAPIITWAAMFVEKVASSPDGAHMSGPPGQWNVYGRFMGFTGFNAIDPAGATESTIVKVLRLVE